MSRTKTITLYQFDELSDKAKEKARDWYRQAGDNYFAEHTTDEFKETLAALGFSVGKGRNDGICWSGFSSQGDGAAFNSSWYASDFDKGGKLTALLADRPAVFKDGETCKSNVELHRIAGVLREIVAKCPESSGSTTTSRGNNMRAEFDSSSDERIEELRNLITSASDVNLQQELDTLESGDMADAFKEACTDLADWFYRALETEYEWQNADEQVDDAMRANEYEFTQEGDIS
jgi:hypothetical protein